eukprot:4187857-Amphidinium_carterae.1
MQRMYVIIAVGTVRVAKVSLVAQTAVQPLTTDWHSSCTQTVRNRQLDQTIALLKPDRFQL